MIRHRSTSSLMGEQLGGVRPTRERRSRAGGRVPQRSEDALRAWTPREPRARDCAGTTAARRRCSRLDHGARTSVRPTATRPAALRRSKGVRGALRQTTGAASARRAAREATRRIAAIDRVAAGFPPSTPRGTHRGREPGAGSLLGGGVRCAGGTRWRSCPPTPGERWSELGVTEGAAAQLQSLLQDKLGREIPVSCSVTRLATRERTLALVLARPL